MVAGRLKVEWQRGLGRPRHRRVGAESELLLRQVELLPVSSLQSLQLDLELWLGEPQAGSRLGSRRAVSLQALGRCHLGDTFASTRGSCRSFYRSVQQLGLEQDLNRSP